MRFHSKRERADIRRGCIKVSDHSTSGGLLRKLQLLQREFDETRGFNFEKALTGISQDTKWPTIRSDFLLQLGVRSI